VRKALGRRLRHVHVETANRFQGLERKVIVALHPLSGKLRPTDFAAEARRMCVAVSRHNRRKTLSDALGVLNERDRRIFEGRRLAEDPITLAELAGEFGVSRERVPQIEVRAFEKVQKAVMNRVAAIETPVHQPMH
jgi:RNA polymerase sigma factor (sigma-70 family)